jgi:hypothetical protein
MRSWLSAAQVGRRQGQPLGDGCSFAKGAWLLSTYWLNVLPAHHQCSPYLLPFPPAGWRRGGTAAAAGAGAPRGSAGCPLLGAPQCDSYTQQQWPAEYGGAVFVAEHGSWNRDTPIGYRIAAVQLSPDGRSVVGHQLFAEGWLRSDGEAWGRPVGLLRLPDGSMLLGDDEANVVYRISYDPSSPPAPRAAAGPGSSGAGGGQRTSAAVAALAAAAAMLLLLPV